ncbi:hypothetical protein D3C80_1294760 [compost metagenome]
MRPQPHAGKPRQCTRGYIDEMMLPGGQYRHSDQRHPAMHQPSPGLALHMPGKHRPDDHQQRNVQRWRLVERFVEAHQHIEQPAEQPTQLWPFEGEPQRPQQEAGDTDHLCAEQCQRVPVHFLACARQQKGQPVEQVDRPVRDDRPGPQRHAALPAEHQAADITTPGGMVVRQPIAEEKQRPQQQKPEHAPADQPWLA